MTVVPYTPIAQDPANRTSGVAAVCIACGSHEDLVLRKETFICRDPWLCQARVQRRSP